MDQFSYLAVLLSIILGLAVTQVLTGFRGLLQSRTTVRLYWPPLAWAFLLLLVFVQSWWPMFGLREQAEWTFAGFAVVHLPDDLQLPASRTSSTRLSTGSRR